MGVSDGRSSGTTVGGGDGFVLRGVSGSAGFVGVSGFTGVSTGASVGPATFTLSTIICIIVSLIHHYPGTSSERRS
jgi:hypothetical protein